MAHHVYNTQGFILESTSRGEANKLYLIFTKELGMVRATAQGVRLIKSKLRYSLQDFSYIKLSIVRGKEIWRITNAQVQENLYILYKEKKDIMNVIAHVFLLIKRLIPGEEKNEELFTVLATAFDFLKTLEFTYDLSKAFEYILVLKILHNLGYHGTAADLDAFIEAEWSHKLLEEMNIVKKTALQEINRSLRETQL
jgi:DNA repair protein RecO (recombination protein O)